MRLIRKNVASGGPGAVNAFPKMEGIAALGVAGIITVAGCGGRNLCPCPDVTPQKTQALPSPPAPTSPEEHVVAERTRLEMVITSDGQRRAKAIAAVRAIHPDGRRQPLDDYQRGMGADRKPNLRYRFFFYADPGGTGKWCLVDPNHEPRKDERAGKPACIADVVGNTVVRTKPGNVKELLYRVVPDENGDFTGMPDLKGDGLGLLNAHLGEAVGERNTTLTPVCDAPWVGLTMKAAVVLTEVR
jgi:hypothetical protein